MYTRYNAMNCRYSRPAQHNTYIVCMYVHVLYLYVHTYEINDIRTYVDKE